MNAYIYTAIPIYSKLKNQRGIESDALQMLVLLLCLLSRLKTSLVHGEVGSAGFYHGWIFKLLWLWTDGFFTLLCMEGIDSFLLALGLISSGGAEAVGHSISTLCMLSVPASPFFSPKAEETTSAAHLPGGNESRSTPGLLLEAVLWLCSKATGRTVCPHNGPESRLRAALPRVFLTSNSCRFLEVLVFVRDKK